MFPVSSQCTITMRRFFDLFRESTLSWLWTERRYRLFFQILTTHLLRTQGTISCQNNEGLHCGPNFEGERLISWACFGNSGESLEEE